MLNVQKNVSNLSIGSKIREIIRYSWWTSNVIHHFNKRLLFV